jgi:NAD(P)-dependent dehydrogenase (short-subunit alcohol dehydrogenase family)
MDLVAVVTGSTSNVGKGIASVLADDGYSVVVTSRNGDEANEVASGLSTAGIGYEVDFSDVGQIEGLFSFVRERYGRLDVLVNNVAYTENETILDCTPETWERTINTNLRSYYMCTRLGAQIMQDNGGGSIVNITISRLRGAKKKFAYSVSKGGVNMLTQSAAIDLAPFNIRVNGVGIGPTGSAVGLKNFPQRGDRTYEMPGAPAGHVGEPADVGHAVSYLVSDKANYVYGEILNVDGGVNIAR